MKILINIDQEILETKNSFGRVLKKSSMIQDRLN